MTQTIRKPTPEETGAVRLLWERCFSDGSPSFMDWFFGKVYLPENTLCLFEGDALASSLQMIPYTLRLRGRDVRADTLSGVDTDPAFRNRGLARGLMRSALDDMAARGVGFNFLYPFDHLFYERLGWKTCSFALEYLKPLPELPESMPEGYLVRPVPQPDAAVLSRIYDRWAQGRNCRAVRGAGDWAKRIGENASSPGFLLLAEYRGEPCAYAFCEEQGEEISAYELVYTRIDAVNALLAALRPRGRSVCWPAPQDDGAALLPGRWKDRARLQPHVMFRIIDVILAFLQAAPAASGEFIVGISGDNMREENNGNYLVKAGNGAAEAARTDRKPQFSCGVGALAAILTGHMDAGEAVSAGLAEGRADTVELLNRMYPKQRNFLFELY